VAVAAFGRTNDKQLDMFKVDVDVKFMREVLHEAQDGSNAYAGFVKKGLL
jgi:hypothetical protein